MRFLKCISFREQFFEKSFEMDFLREQFFKEM